MKQQAWIWIRLNIILAIHEEQLDEHGGLVGVRDKGLLESALARPEHLAAYGKPDAAELAASYAYGISRNHPFLDGNKRTAFVTAVLFLRLNGYNLVASDMEKVLKMLDVAAGDISEESFAEWIRQHATLR